MRVGLHDTYGDGDLDDSGNHNQDGNRDDSCDHHQFANLDRSGGSVGDGGISDGNRDGQGGSVCDGCIGSGNANRDGYDCWCCAGSKATAVSGANVPSRLPRSGDIAPWAGPFALILGVLLLAAGLAIRRARA